jgi:hypothetical protein
MGTVLRRADELHPGDRVITDNGTVTVTSTRIEGAAGGVVSVGYADHPGRSRYRPGDRVTVLVRAETARRSAG